MPDSPLVVLAANVLVNFALCDTLLRLAEPPAFFEPKWSNEIIRETIRTLQGKLGWPHHLAVSFEAELRSNFADAWIDGFQPLISRMTNDEKDRHVLAAAVHGAAPVIVTFNLRHFTREHLDPWGVRAMHPEAFLAGLFHEDPSLVKTKLKQQASDRGRSLHQLLNILTRTVPAFVAEVAER